MSQNDDYLALCVGNTQTRVAHVRNEQIESAQSLPNAEMDQVKQWVADQADKSPDLVAVIASVNRPFCESLVEALPGVLGDEAVGRIGCDIPIPLKMALDDSSTVGQDRLLCALAAFHKTGQPCVVVDLGTAITVDFIDADGVFQGGFILPGLNMMLRALHQQTSALPVVNFVPPDDTRGALGKDTPHAMILGALAAVKGGIRDAIESTARVCGSYPQIVATGGDMAVLEHEGLVEHFVPDLQIYGLIECVRAARENDDPDE